MRLVIVSNMAHYRRGDGAIVGHGATARELSALATLFDDVRHVACLHPEPPPASARAYDAGNITLVPVPPAGGDNLTAKLDILRLTPLYVRTMLRELRDADAVHVRAPANISLYAILALAARREPARRWIKYAGAWQPDAGEPAFYGIQRRLLARASHRSQVSINGSWPGQPAHVHTLANPSLSDDDLRAGERAARTKRLTQPLQLAFVGHFGAAKNPRAAIETVAELRKRGIEARLELAGEGDNAAELAALATQLHVADAVTVRGPLGRVQLDDLYARAHFVVLPSRTEGWPKVLSEGMAFGAVPIATAVGSIPSLLERFATGRALPTASGQTFAEAIAGYVQDPARWERERDRAVDAAAAFSYSAYLRDVRRLLDL